MSEFRTLVNVSPSQLRISYESSLLSIGSCFAQNMGEKLSWYKFSLNLNPFGIIYNPASVSAALSCLLSDAPLSEHDFIQHNGLWHSWLHHGSFSKVEKADLQEAINESRVKAASDVRASNILIITWGTAYVYEYLETGKVVANCHKLPDKEFRRYRLSVAEIIESYSSLFAELKAANKDIKIIITVSPVRHLKDGAVENNRSKSTLVLAAAELAGKIDFVEYFPAYEIMIDDLRDYRFYKADMVHPNEVAIDYIWERFCDTYIDTAAQKLMSEVSALQQALNHRPIRPETADYLEFLEKQMEKALLLSSKLPISNFSTEITLLKSRIARLKKQGY